MLARGLRCATGELAVGRLVAAWWGSARARQGRMAVLAALPVLCAVLPIWSSRFLPLLDEPNHLSTVYIWHGLTQDASPVQEFYGLAIAPVSYLSYYGLAWLLALGVGVELGHKLALTLSVLALPAVAYGWCRCTGRTRWLALLTLPLAYSYSWAHGYHPFNLALVSGLWALLAQLCLVQKPSLQRWGLALLAAVVCYFGHPLPLALLYGGSLIIWALYIRNARGLVQVVSSLLPSMGLLAWQSTQTQVGAGAWARVLGPEFPVVEPAVWWSRLMDFPAHAVNPWAGTTDSQVIVMVLGALVAMGVDAVDRGEQAPNRPPDPALRKHLCLWLSAGGLLLYLGLSEHFHAPVYMWIARGRLAPVVAFFLIVWTPLAPGARPRLMPLGIMLLLPLLCWLGVSTALRYRAFGQELAGMERVLEACPAGEEVLTLELGRPEREGEPLHGDYDLPVFRELPSWVQVVHGGGFTPEGWERPIPFPYVRKRTLAAPAFRHHRRSYRRYLAVQGYGCVLTHQQPDGLKLPGWVRCAEQGGFQLWRRGCPETLGH